MSELYYSDDDDNDNTLKKSKNFDDTIKKKAQQALERINNYIHTDKTIVDRIDEIAKNIRSETDNPYYYCDKSLINKIHELIKSYHKLNADANAECCICLDKCEFKEREYFVCRHFVCKTCYQISNKYKDTKCPICRTVIHRCTFSEKYALICTGLPAKFNIFDNGGYKSICIAYFPAHEVCTIFSDITYYDDNEQRIKFVEKVNKLLESGYSIILQDHVEVRKWMNEIMLKEFATNKSFINE